MVRLGLPCFGVGVRRSENAGPEWAVTVELAGNQPLNDDSLDQLLDQLAAHHVGGVATRPDDAWFSTTITVTATSPSRAVDTGVKAIAGAVGDEWTPVLAEVMTLDRQGQTPAQSELVAQLRAAVAEAHDGRTVTLTDDLLAALDRC